jgi:hypothetical protein
LECDRIATFGVTPNSLSRSAACAVDAAIALGVRIERDVRVEEEEHAAIVEHRAHRRDVFDARIERDDALQIAELLVVAADQPADQRVGLAARDHQRGDHGRARAHDRLGTSGVTPRRSFSS